MKTYMWLMLAGTLLGACSSNEEAATMEKAELAVMAAPPLQAPASSDNAGSLSSEGSKADAAPEAQEPNAQVVPGIARKIIYHAEMRVRVESLELASARIDSLTQAFGAYVSQASESREDGQWQHEMKIRVEPGRFPALLGSLSGLGTLESKNLGTDDVTAEHADISARLRTKRALEQRYIALLAQARKVSEVLEIEEKLAAVRGDIEATESRLKTLNDKVDYSTITLTYFQILPLDTPNAPILSFGSRLVEAFYDGWELLTGLVLALITVWPLLALGGFAFWGLRVWRQRRLKRSGANSSAV